jgi:hypothetical protein
MAKMRKIFSGLPGDHKQKVRSEDTLRSAPEKGPQEMPNDTLAETERGETRLKRSAKADRGRGRPHTTAQNETDADWLYCKAIGMTREQYHGQSIFIAQNLFSTGK